MYSPQDILDFWFQEITPSMWWQKDLAFDDNIKQRFGDIYNAARDCALGDSNGWRTTAQGYLAEIIILDQFSRNIYRDTPQAFISDPQALTLSQEAIKQGFDNSLSAVEKSFLYMPFMHSESLVVHETAVKLYEKNGIQNNLDFELQHKKIIEKFGRYPHRNIILGRESTPEELAFLQQPNSSF